MSLAGRRALVTGGTRGIGLATALGLAESGAAVAVSWAHSPKDAASALATLTARGARAHAVEADVGDPAAVRRMFAEVTESLGGPPDVLVNNAAITEDGLLMMLAEEAWDRVVRTDLTGASLCCRLAAEGPAGASPRLFAATVSNAAAGELAIAYRLAGPAVTVTAGGASGLAALGEAIELIRAGRADVVVAGGVDALGGAVADWLDAAGLEFGRPPAEAGAVLVLERPGRTRPEIGRLAGHAAGFEPDPLDPAAGEGLARAIDAACADAGLSPREIAVIVSGAPPQLAALEDRALAAMPGGRRLSPKTVFGETLGAAGPLALLAALAEAEPGLPVLVLDACPSGHVAALVARASEAR